MTFTTFTSALFSKASAFSASIESSCLRLGSLVAVFRALEWMIRLAHEELSPTTVAVGLALSMRTKIASGVTREKRGSCGTGLHSYTGRSRALRARLGERIGRWSAQTDQWKIRLLTLEGLRGATV